MRVDVNMKDNGVREGEKGERFKKKKKRRMFKEKGGDMMNDKEIRSLLGRRKEGSGKWS